MTRDTTCPSGFHPFLLNGLLTGNKRQVGDPKHPSIHCFPCENEGRCAACQLPQHRKTVKSTPRRAPKKKALVRTEGQEWYWEYLQTPGWAAKREEAFRFHGRVCAACGATSGLNVHHMTYVRCPNKEDVENDLRVLCEPCHLAVHAIEHRSTKKDLMMITLRYIERRRAAVARYAPSRAEAMRI